MPTAVMIQIRSWMLVPAECCLKIKGEQSWSQSMLTHTHIYTTYIDIVEYMYIYTYAYNIYFTILRTF